ncbi:hypothetical protein SELMODRAFT_416634 [Selaginella moellendorffii]|uniref:Uncharacterized protein n=1 Tax=Selaginella moellendorffii TaxID=88036 RepID=D8RZX6_SELML|nr:hypothetical protein SELMODRAFT_416634 [Selaginella moellendorffii]
MKLGGVAGAGGVMGMEDCVVCVDGTPGDCRRLPCAMAYTWCLAAWRAYEESPGGILREKAEEDLRESHAVAICCVAGHFMGSCLGSMFVTDNELFKLVALLYLSRRLQHSSRFKDCARYLDGSGCDGPKLRAFSEFGTSLGMKLAERDPKQRLTHCLDELWGDWRSVLDSILHTDFVFLMPPRHEGPATSLLLKQLRKHIKALKGTPKKRPLCKVRDKVASHYEAELGRNWSASYRLHTQNASREYIWGRDIGATCGLPYPNDAEEWSRYGFLTVGQAVELLKAAKDNQLLEALVMEPPPNSVLISNIMAILDCTEHARLWLAKSKLPVYYNFPHLTYAKLRDEESTSTLSQECKLALESPLGFAARIPSPVEKFLRRLAIDANGELLDDEDVSGWFAVLPEGFNSGKILLRRLQIPRGVGNDLQDKDWLRQVSHTVTLLSNNVSPKEHVSDFVRTAQGTSEIDWPEC